MARARMLAKSLSTSERYWRLHSVAGRLAEFCQSMYPLLIAHSDDYGRLQGDAQTVKFLIVPATPRKVEEVHRALEALHTVGLICWYDIGPGGRKAIQIVAFDEHQAGLHKRTKSRFPPPPNFQTGKLDASEAEIEAFIAGELLSGRLSICDFTVTNVQRQVRKGSRYLDLVAQTTVGTRLLVEVKRQRVTKNAISQINEYRRLLPEPVIPIVIGNGVAPDLDLSASDVIVGSYDDDMRIVMVCDMTLNHKPITLNHIPVEEKRTEEKRTEQKKRTAAAPQHVTVPDADPDPESHYAVITALVGKEILPLRLPDPELMQATKDRCEELKITYTPETVRKAVDSALFRYYRQMRRDFELPADPRGIFHDSKQTRH